MILKQDSAPQSDSITPSIILPSVHGFTSESILFVIGSSLTEITSIIKCVMIVLDTETYMNCSQ